MNAIEHGTYSGYCAERRRGIPPCDECRAANAGYARELRAASPDSYRREKAAQAAYRRALTRLARIYPDLFRALEDEERAKEPALRGAAS